MPGFDAFAEAMRIRCRHLADRQTLSRAIVEAHLNDVLGVVCLVIADETEAARSRLNQQDGQPGRHADKLRELHKDHPRWLEVVEAFVGCFAEPVFRGEFEAQVAAGTTIVGPWDAPCPLWDHVRNLLGEHAMAKLHKRLDGYVDQWIALLEEDPEAEDTAALAAGGESAADTIEFHVRALIRTLISGVAADHSLTDDYIALLEGMLDSSFEERRPRIIVALIPID